MSQHVVATRICNTCGKELLLDQFRLRRKGHTAREGRCRTCHAKYMREYRRQRRARDHGRLVAACARSSNAAKVGSIVNALIAAAGGVNRFADRWRAEFDAAPLGSRLASNHLLAIVQLAGWCDG